MKKFKNKILKSFIHKLPRTDINKGIQIVKISIKEVVHAVKQIIFDYITTLKKFIYH